MFETTSVGVSRRAVLRGLAAGISAAMLPTLVGQQVWAQEGNCVGIWRELDMLWRAFAEYRDRLGSMATMAPKAAGLQDVQAVANQSLMLAAAMSKLTGAGIVKGAVLQGVQSQAASIQSAIKKLGPDEAQQRLVIANQAMASGQYEAVAQDPVFGPVVSAGVESYKQYSLLLQQAAGAMQRMEQNSLERFAKQLSEARSAKQLSDEHIKGLLQIYGHHPGITEVLMRVGAMRIGSTALPAGLLTAGVSSALSEPTVAATCRSCAAEAEGGNRWLAWLGISEARAFVEVPVITLGAVVVTAVSATVAFFGSILASVTGFNDCFRPEEPPNPFDACIASAQRVLEEALARAEQNRRNCLAQEICLFGGCLPYPALLCDGAYEVETAGAHAVFWASEVACSLVT